MTANNRMNFLNTEIRVSTMRHPVFGSQYAPGLLVSLYHFLKTRCECFASRNKVEAAVLFSRSKKKEKNT